VPVPTQPVPIPPLPKSALTTPDDRIILGQPEPGLEVMIDAIEVTDLDLEGD